MKFFEPIWKTNKREKLEEALAAVREITDPGKLQEAALSAWFPEVRSAALERITDQKMLHKVILANETDYEIRREAVRRISDPEVLTEIAMQRQAYPADGDAIAMLSDQEQLRRIALSEQGGEQDKAVYKIGDQGVLGEIAENAKKGSARKTAIRNITDPGILLDVMSTAEEVYTRGEAYDRLVLLRRTGKLPKLSEEQHRKVIDFIVHEDDRNVRIELNEFCTTDDLMRIYREAARYDLRAKALDSLVRDRAFPDSELQEAWKTAESGRKTVYNTRSNPWQDAKQTIETRITGAADTDPEMLLAFVQDPAVGSEFAADCLKSLFDEKFEGRERIAFLRDEAFAAYLRNIPHYAETDQKTTLQEYILRLAHAVPRQFHDEYGLTVFLEENEQADPN